MASECSVCGSNGSTSLVLIEGARVEACMKCARFGKSVSRKAVVFEKPQERFVEVALIEDYGNVIRLAREREGFSQEDLCKKLALNLQLLQQIEAQKFKPQEGIGRKIEQFLKISIYSIGNSTAKKEEKSSIKTSNALGPSNREFTLADIVQFKKKQ